MASPVALPLSSLRARSVPKGVVISAPLLSVALSPLSSLRLLSFTTHPERNVSRERTTNALKNRMSFIAKFSSSLVRCDDGAVEPGASISDPRNGYRSAAVNADLTEQRFGSRNLRDAGDGVSA